MIGLESYFILFSILIDFKLYVGPGAFDLMIFKSEISNIQTWINEDMHDRAILRAIVPDPPDPRALKARRVDLI